MERKLNRFFRWWAHKMAAAEDDASCPFILTNETERKRDIYHLFESGFAQIIGQYF